MKEYKTHWNGHEHNCTSNYSSEILLQLKISNITWNLSNMLIMGLLTDLLYSALQKKHGTKEWRNYVSLSLLIKKFAS